MPDLGPVQIGASELHLLADALDAAARTSYPAARP